MHIERSYVTYDMYLKRTLIIWWTIYEIQPPEHYVTLIWPLRSSKVKGHHWEGSCWNIKLFSSLKLSFANYSHRWRQLSNRGANYYLPGIFSPFITYTTWLTTSLILILHINIKLNINLKTNIFRSCSKLPVDYTQNSVQMIWKL